MDETIRTLKLQVDGQKMTILHYRAVIQRDLNIASSTQTHFHLTIEYSNEEIWSWAAGDLSKDGEILFYASEDESAFRKISFKNARCVMLEETRQYEDALRMATSFVLSAETITSGQATFTNKAMEKSRLYQ